ncbi:MAG TPA: SLATT domain-containing protein [Polyangiaceae bacterium]|nr:SLATT domain-containing protein [Polyangiaceae bacterium]
MGNPNAADVQRETVELIWRHYRAQAGTSRRLKAQRGWWQRILLWVTIIALLVTPFSKTFEKLGWDRTSAALTIAATVIFSLMAWFQKEVLSDDAEQAWVRARQAGEGFKALAFRFLAGVPPFDVAGNEAALSHVDALAGKVATPDRVADDEASKNIPPAPLSFEDYLKLRVDDQINFYRNAIERARGDQSRTVLIGRAISASVVVFGALGGVIAKDWREIWAPFLSAAATLTVTQSARSRHRYLIDSYSVAADKLELAKTRYKTSNNTAGDQKQLVETVEGVLTNENAAWVQQMLLKPTVPDVVKPSTPKVG